MFYTCKHTGLFTAAVQNHVWPYIFWYNHFLLHACFSALIVASTQPYTPSWYGVSSLNIGTRTLPTTVEDICDITPLFISVRTTPEGFYLGKVVISQWAHLVELMSWHRFGNIAITKANASIV